MVFSGYGAEMLRLPLDLKNICFQLMWCFKRELSESILTQREWEKTRFLQNSLAHEEKFQVCPLWSEVRRTGFSQYALGTGRLNSD
uniref:Uncharacterized protein n=1 Tax=Anguilla anguilla TaxID=7936 RepID=A0A0E9R2C0_ANGAN